MERVLETYDQNTYDDDQDYLNGKMLWLLKLILWESIGLAKPVPQPLGKNVMKYYGVYNIKFTFDGVVECHKAQLVAKDFS